jgi:predicted phosphohydrolase
MAIYCISDTHLSLTVPKPMDVFGNRWRDYEKKLEIGWNSVVGENDTVIVPGDISWGLDISEAAADLKFLSSLNGKKIIGKGNHDLWWQSEKKLKELFSSEGIENVSLLHNNAYIIDGLMWRWVKNENLSGSTYWSTKLKLVRREWPIPGRMAIQATDGTTEVPNTTTVDTSQPNTTPSPTSAETPEETPTNVPEEELGDVPEEATDSGGEMPLTGLKEELKQLFEDLQNACDGNIRLVSARRWAVDESGKKVDGNAFVMKNGLYKCKNA